MTSDPGAGLRRATGPAAGQATGPAARLAMGRARGAVVVMLVGLLGTALLLPQVGNWDDGALTCTGCATQLFQRHLVETLVALCLPLAAIVLGTAALVRNFRTARSRSALVVAGIAVLLGLASAAVLASVATEPLQRQAAQAEQARQPPTAQETSFTSQELEDAMQDLVRSSLASVQPLPGVAGDPRGAGRGTAPDALRASECRLSNLAAGRSYTFEVALKPTGQAEQVSEVLERNWLKAGYLRSNPSQGGDMLLSGNGKLPARYLAVSNDTVPGEPSTIAVRIASICVRP